MRHSKNDLRKEAQWELWYQDSFDRESPRQKEVTGIGLKQGLCSLWAYHLYETIRPEGCIGFSHFNLWLDQQKLSIEIKGDLKGQIKLRQWLFEGRSVKHLPLLQIADETLVTLIAEFHMQLGLKEQTSARIIEMADAARDRDDFLGEIMAFIEAANHSGDSLSH